MKWIEEIISKEPYKITCKWNDGKVTIIDLYEFLLEKSKNPNNSYSQLINTVRFLQVKCDGSTLCWENGITYTDTDGTIKQGELDIAPELLYDIAMGFDVKKDIQNA